MVDRRDSPDFEPIETDESEPGPGRRFARLVASPASRKVALPRLLIASVLTLGLLVLVGLGVTWLLKSVGQWVDQRPEHQLRFDQIELAPPPDPWIKGGSSLILEQVRTGAKLGETISLLDLDLKGLELDFRRSPWVKDVLSVDRSNYGRLIVSLIYRRPVAILQYGPSTFPYVLDEEAVVLNHKNIDWISWKDPFRPQGMGAPLVKIEQDLKSYVPQTFGLKVKRKSEGDSLAGPDTLVEGAARLARFLQDRNGAIGSVKDSVTFASLYLPTEGTDHSYFLEDSGHHLVEWGRAPGDDRPGEPSSDARWTMLRNWIKTNGTLEAKYPDFLQLTSKEAAIVRRRPFKSK